MEIALDLVFHEAVDIGASDVGWGSISDEGNELIEVAAVIFPGVGLDISATDLLQEAGDFGHHQEPPRGRNDWRRGNHSTEGGALNRASTHSVNLGINNDPGVGRMLTPDTIVPDPAAPQAFNRFSYVMNKPMRFIDPSGHCGADVNENGSRDEDLFEECVLIRDEFSGEHDLPIEGEWTLDEMNLLVEGLLAVNHWSGVPLASFVSGVFRDRVNVKELGFYCVGEECFSGSGRAVGFKWMVIHNPSTIPDSTGLNFQGTIIHEAAHGLALYEPAILDWFIQQTGWDEARLWFTGDVRNLPKHRSPYSRRSFQGGLSNRDAAEEDLADNLGRILATDNSVHTRAWVNKEGVAVMDDVMNVMPGILYNEPQRVER